MNLTAAKHFAFMHILSTGIESATVCYWAIVKDGQITNQGEGNLQQAAVACGRLPCALALPLDGLVVTKLTLPTKNNNQRRTAIPFALQNQLASSAKDLHWSWLAQGQQLQLVGIPHSQLQWLETTLKQAGLTPKWIVADGLYLGASSSHWQILITANTWLLQYGEHLACSIKLANDNDAGATEWLQKAYHEAQQSAAGAPLSIHCKGQIPEQLQTWIATNGIATKSATPPPNNNSATILALNFVPKKCINILPRKHPQGWIANINWRLWRLPYTLLIALGLIALGHLWLGNQALELQLQHSLNQGRAYFQQVLPDERMVDPLSQLQSHMSKAQRPKREALLLPMLYAYQHQRELLEADRTGTAAKQTSISNLNFGSEQLAISLIGNQQQLQIWPQEESILADQFVISAAAAVPQAQDWRLTLTIKPAPTTGETN